MNSFDLSHSEGLNFHLVNFHNQQWISSGIAVRCCYKEQMLATLCTSVFSFRAVGITTVGNQSCGCSDLWLLSWRKHLQHTDPGSAGRHEPQVLNTV